MAVRSLFQPASGTGARVSGAGLRESPLKNTCRRILTGYGRSCMVWPSPLPKLPRCSAGSHALARHDMRPWWCAVILGAVCFAASPAAALDWETLAGFSTAFGNSGYAHAGVGIIQPVSARIAPRARLVFGFLD